MEVSPTNSLNFSLKDVCKFAGVKDPLFAENANSTQVDCMGKKVQVHQFCLSKLKGDNEYLRGFVNKDNQVICQRGSRVQIKIKCKKEGQGLCTNAESGCGKVKNIYAHALEEIHASLLFEKGDHYLHCYFAKSLNFQKWQDI